MRLGAELMIECGWSAFGGVTKQMFELFNKTFQDSLALRCAPISRGKRDYRRTSGETKRRLLVIPRGIRRCRATFEDTVKRVLFSDHVADRTDPRGV